jgi:hypothetical protein
MYGEYIVKSRGLYKGGPWFMTIREQNNNDCGNEKRTTKQELGGCGI